MEQILFFLVTIINILKYAILVRVLLSWVNIDQSAQWYQILYNITEPLLKFVRNIMPKTGMIDLSPILVFFALEIIQSGVVKLFANF